MESHGKDARRVRFESIEGLQRRDVPIACEVWLDDVMRAKWSSREAMKLAAHLVRYMVSGDVRLLALGRIEHQTQLTRDEINGALRGLKQHRAIEAYSIQGDQLLVGLLLTTLQKVRVLEARQRLETLSRELAQLADDETPKGRWLPPAPAEGELAATE